MGVPASDARRGPVRAGAGRARDERHPGAARAGAVHAEEPAGLRPSVDPDARGRDAGRETGGPLSGLRRPEDLLWFANQRAKEYHPTLFRGHAYDAPTHLVVDLDPPADSDAFASAVQGALLVRQALRDVAMTALVKTSGAKGVHVVVPLVPGQSAMHAGKRRARDRRAAEPDN
jgi:DNA primase